MPLRTDPVVSVRLAPLVLEAVDALAAEADVSRAAWITAAIGSAIIDHARVGRALSERGRAAPAGLADSMPLPTPSTKSSREQDAARKAGPAPATNLREQRAAAYREKMGR